MPSVNKDLDSDFMEKIFRKIGDSRVKAFCDTGGILAIQ